jgi:SAM-dependent methyltransferase
MKDPNVEAYDSAIFSPVTRDWYGTSDFYNVGYWSSPTLTQAEASTALVNRLLDRHAQDPGTVLDVGCGLGATTSAIKHRWPFAHVTGINLSEAQVEHCRRNHRDCDFAVMNATALTFSENSFDVIFSAEAAFHFNTRRDFFSQAHRALKPGGSLLVADILLDREHPLSKKMLAWDVPTNLDQANPDDYKTCLEDFGYRNVLVEDATEQTWRSWIRQLIEKTESTGVPAPHRYLHDANRSNVVTYYVLVSAHK